MRAVAHCVWHDNVSEGVSTPRVVHHSVQPGNLQLLRVSYPLGKQELEWRDSSRNLVSFWFSFRGAFKEIVPSHSLVKELWTFH